MKIKNNLSNDSDDGEVDSAAHKRLLNGINSISKTKQIKKATRNEPAIKKSEFHLIKNGNLDEGKEKIDVDVSDLVGILKKTSKHTELGKLLKNVKQNQKTLSKPLEKPEADRIQRALGYDKAKSELEQWVPVITANDYADQQVFPLKYGTIGVAGKAPQKLSQYRVKSEMMVAMDELKKKYRDDQDSDDDPEDDKYPLTLEEMKQKSAELARQRIRESYKIAKGKRTNKIKSKKYHKLLKREKVKQQINDFEQLQKTDPEAAMKQLELLDKQRFEERASLRHKNTGSWAKNLQIRAKYDMEVRKELAQSLALSRELTQKQNLESDSESEEEEFTEAVAAEDNPWVKKVAAKDGKEEADFVSGYRKYWNTRNKDEKDLHEYFQSSNVENLEEDEEVQVESSDDDEEIEQFKNVFKKSVVSGPMEWVEEDNSDGIAEKDVDIEDIFDEAEYNLQEKVSRKLKKLRADLENEQKTVAKTIKNDRKTDNSGLAFKKKASRADQDVALNEGGLGEDVEIDLNKIPSTKIDVEKVESNINPNKFVQIKHPKHLLTALPDMVVDGEISDDDGEEDASKRMTIAEAFEDDDIVADFMKEKEDEKNKNTPQDIDLTLPGWGTWGGSGTKPPSKRLILKAPKEIPRRDDNKHNVMINEDQINKKLRTHLVTDIPFPFTSVKEYEASIRAPIGRTFVTEIAHKLLTKPSVVTKLGSIIEPMKKEILLQQNQPKRFNKFLPKPEKQFREFLENAKIV